MFGSFFTKKKKKAETQAQQWWTVTWFPNKGQLGAPVVSTGQVVEL